MSDWRDWFEWFTLGDWAEAGIEWLIATFRFLLELLRDLLLAIYNGLEAAFTNPAWWLAALVAGVLGWLVAQWRQHGRAGRIGVLVAGAVLLVDAAVWTLHRFTGFATLETYGGPYDLLALDRPIFPVLLLPPSWIMILLLGGLAFAALGWRLGLVATTGLLLIDLMDQWRSAMETLAMVTVAVAVASLLAIPIGIWAARSRMVSGLVRPVLDLMQTMPALIYVLVAVFMFRVGVVPGIVATLIFAMPPGIRLTELGIRQVDAEVVEAGRAFGSSPGKILRQIQLPLAMPTIMAGVNQIIMLSLSMVVLAGFVGAPGLGQQVITAISRTNLSLGVEAGLAVVILAIYLDRVTAALSGRSAAARLERAG